MTWSQAIRNQLYRTQLLITLALLLACALVAPILFNWIEQRPGYRLADPLLEVLPATDASRIIFALLYLFIIAGLFKLMHKPEKLLLALQAFLHVTLLRFITMSLVPLDRPEGLIILRDPFIEYFFYQQTITKDLFFSGHAGMLILLYLLFRSDRVLGWIYLAGALTVSLLLLLQHVHYTIDVIAAPLFVWLGYRVAKWYPKNFEAS